MKYDREWLKRVNATKQIIPKIQELIPRIPQIQDRRLVREQFTAAVDEFGRDLMSGLDTEKVEKKIYDLGELAAQLVNGEDEHEESEWE